MKKIFAIGALVVALGAGMYIYNSSKNVDYDWVVKIDGASVSPQQYVTAQLQSYVEAQLISGEKDVLNCKISDLDGEEWINQNTLKLLKRYKCISDMAEERNLVFSSGAENYIDLFASDSWENVESMYTKNGLSEEYYKQYLKALQLEQMLFKSIYSKDSELNSEKGEVADYIDNNLCRMTYFTVPKSHPDGTPYNEEENNELRNIIKDTFDEIDDDENIEKISEEIKDISEDITVNSIETMYVSKSILNVDIENFKDISDALFGLDVGDNLYYEASDKFYICKRIDLCDTEVEYTCLKWHVMSILKDDEFEKYIQDACDEMEVELNEDALKRYSPSQIDIIVN